MHHAGIDIDIAHEADAAAFVALAHALDAETEFMLYEPGERTITEEAQAMLFALDFAASRRVVLLAKDRGVAVGYVGVMAGATRRTRHVASLALGVRRSHWRRGIGTALMSRAIGLAAENGITRLELMVRTDNRPAIRLYEASGFSREGVRRRALRIAGHYHDEYFMGREIGPFRAR